MVANWIPTSLELGTQPIETTDTTQNHALGTIRKARHVTYGEGEFIYLTGVANTVVGSVVTYDTQGASVLVPNTANLAAPLAVSMSANVASQYGWYQIGGNAVIKKTAVKVSPAVSLFISATAGRLMSTAASGKAVLGCKSANTATVASATSTIVAILDRPHAQGQVT